MLMKFLDNLKAETKENFPIILAAATADVKFNNVDFGKKTSPQHFIDVCCKCKKAVGRYV